jgi:hypothetical protein
MQGVDIDTLLVELKMYAAELGLGVTATRGTFWIEASGDCVSAIATIHKKRQRSHVTAKLLRRLRASMSIAFYEDPNMFGTLQSIRNSYNMRTQYCLHLTWFGAAPRLYIMTSGVGLENLQSDVPSPITITQLSHPTPIDNAYARIDIARFNHYMNIKGVHAQQGTLEERQRVLVTIKKACGYCHKLNGKKRTCGNCMLSRYCNKECQSDDWQEHKVICPVLFLFAEDISRTC